MTLIEALKECSIENCDTTELLYDCDLSIYDEDKEVYENMIRCLKGIVMPSTYDIFNTTDITPEIIDKIVEGELIEELSDYDVAYICVAAAIAAYRNYEPNGEDGYIEFYEPSAKYEISLFGRMFTWGGDIDTL